MTSGRSCRPRARLPRAAAVVAALAAVALLSAPAGAQSSTAEKIREQREELARIRQEREDLRERMADLQGTMHSLSEEMANLDRQAVVTARAVRSLDTQLAYITEEVGEATTNLHGAEGELGDKRRVLRRRLIDIYKRGPLYSVEVLLSAESFGALVARYKYLHLLALHDRALVHRVEQLRNTIVGQRELLVRLQNEVEQNRLEKAAEEERLRLLEQQRERSLAQAKKRAKQTQLRLAQIEKAEARLSSVIGRFEEARRRAESRPNAARPSASTIRTADLGKLDWPVEGSVLYRFGRVVNPNKTTTRWNGIGIGAPAGTAVKAIAGGTVAVAEAIGTYGLTVIVQHGGGDYSVYGSLARAEVQRGGVVKKGQTIGTVGAADPDLGPHLHFEIRRARGVAVDPLEWLRAAR
jgi:septal ring factor EnvC (AmiA/AmiB activator)